MKSKKTNNGVAVKKNESPNGETSKKEWVFIPLSKELVLKTTDKYILFRIGGGASAIVSAKFKRQKESEKCIYLSVPPEYRFGCQYREYNDKQRKYVTQKSWDVSANAMRNYLEDYDADEIIDIDDLDDVPIVRNKPNPENDLDAIDLPDDDLPF